jgi:hypothetical protein
MQIPQSLLKSINLLNLGLLVIAAAGIACAVAPLADISVNVTPRPMTETTAGQSAPAAPENHPPAYTDYTLIAEQNLFHPSRLIPASGAQAMARPEIILYGTLITDNMRIAYLEDKKSLRTTPGRGKRQIALKKGESLNGYVLTAVEKDRIELVKGGDKIVVYLSDQNKARLDETTRSASAPASPRPTVQPMAAPTSSQPAVQPRARPAAPPPVVQPRTTPSGSQAPVQQTVPPRVFPATPSTGTAPR